MILWGLEGCFNQCLPSPLLFFHLSIPCCPLPSFPSLLSKFLLFPPFLFFLLLLLSSFHLILFISVPSLPLLSAFVFSTPFFLLLSPLYSWCLCVLLSLFLIPLSSSFRACGAGASSLPVQPFHPGLEPASSPLCRSGEERLAAETHWGAGRRTQFPALSAGPFYRQHEDSRGWDVRFILVYLHYYGFWLTSEHQDEMQTEVQWTCSLVCSMQSKKICKIHFKCKIPMKDEWNKAMKCATTFIFSATEDWEGSVVKQVYKFIF